MHTRSKKLSEDAAVEITVGPKDADVAGLSGRAIQIAIDAVAAEGGGTVRIAAGEYTLDDSIRLRPNVRLVGVADQTVLRRGPLVWSKLAIDADKSEQQATPVDASPWSVGMGVCFFDQRDKWAELVAYRIVAIKEGTLYFDRRLTQDRRAEEDGLVVNVFPMIFGGGADNAALHGLVIDASVDNREGILTGAGCHAVYVRESVNVHFSNLIVRHALCDGIVCGDSSTGAVIEDCEISDCFNYGIHPGSHSARCVVRRCHIHDNGSDGLYVCWGIRHGEFTDNVITNNGVRAHRSGICIGHKDTDCLIARNRITGNRKHGIAFRQKTAANGAHRATVRENIIEDNGSPREELSAIKDLCPAYESEGCGIHVEGITNDLIIEGNHIRETRSGEVRHQRHGIVIEEGVTIAQMKNNVIEGHPESAFLDRSRQAASRAV